MVLTVADWKFRVDKAATMEHTICNSTDHCLCPYCRNFYDTVDIAHPRLRQVLEQFGIQMEGPSEVMPLQHNIVLVCYRVQGAIVHRGRLQLYVDDVPVYPEEGDGESFLLWVGAMELPWIQDVKPEDVLSPANEPEFLKRMAEKYLELTEQERICS